MSRNLHLRWWVTALAIGGAACGHEPTTPAVPMLSHQAGGAGGAVLVRGIRTTFLAHLDAERGLLSIHAPATLCTVGSFNTADAQFVISPSEIEQFIAKLQAAEEQVAVYAAASFGEAGMVGTAETAGVGGIVDVGAFCAFLEGPSLVAQGVVRRISVLSNASFVARWTGGVTGADGEPVQLTEVYQLGADAQDPNNPDTWVVDVSSVLLN